MAILGLVLCGLIPRELDVGDLQGHVLLDAQTGGHQSSRLLAGHTIISVLEAVSTLVTFDHLHDLARHRVGDVVL